MLLRARIVLPLRRAAIEDGAVLIDGGQIARVGAWRQVSRGRSQREIDLGDVILLPGLINAHCHLDYTAMAGLVRSRNLPDWIKELVALKADWSYSDYAESWLRGASMLLRTGTTTVADIESIPDLLPEVWSATPLRVWSFLEMTGVKSGMNPMEILGRTIAFVNQLPASRGGVGLSPHALYSTTPELLQAVARERRNRNWLIATHVAESVEEREMYRHRRGAFFRWLKGQRNMADCGGVSPLERIDDYGLVEENFLAIHANYLTSRDTKTLGKKGASVVHCPRSHSFFRHRPFPYRELASAGVNICLGTDSLASAWKPPRGRAELSMFEEMRHLASGPLKLSPALILKMATMNGAKALGLEGRAGELSPGSDADLITIPYAGGKSDAYAAAVNYPGEVSAAMIGGQWAVRETLA